MKCLYWCRQIDGCMDRSNINTINAWCIKAIWVDVILLYKLRVLLSLLNYFLFKQVIDMCHVILSWPITSHACHILCIVKRDRGGGYLNFPCFVDFCTFNSFHSLVCVWERFHVWLNNYLIEIVEFDSRDFFVFII